FEDFALALVSSRETLQGEIHGYNLFHLFGREDHGSIDWNVNGGASPFHAASLSRVIHKNVPHHLRSNGEKMRAIAPSGVFTRKEAQKRFLNLRGGLHRMVLALRADVTARKTIQFRTD